MAVNQIESTLQQSLRNQKLPSAKPRKRPFAAHSANQLALATIMFLGLLWLSAPPELPFEHKFLATVIAGMVLAPWYFWLKSPHRMIPFFELICLHLFLIFSLPVFLGPVTLIGSFPQITIAGSDLTKALVVVILGVSCAQLTFYRLRMPRWKQLPAFQLDPQRIISICLIYLAVSVFGPILIGHLPRTLAKVGDLVFRINGCVAAYALAVLLYSGRLSASQRRWYLVELGLLLVTSLATGWLNIFAYPVLAVFLAEIQVKKRLPWRKIFVVALAFLALETSKGAFREEYWGGRMGSGSVGLLESFDRTANWIQMVPTSIESLFSGAREKTVGRVSHLGYLGDVVRKTPDYIPYLKGYSYRCIPAMLIPRFMWPGKPSTMMINNELVLLYGWLHPALIGRVAVSPGLMDEAYMNFGIFGVVLFMSAFGLFIQWATVNLGNPENGLGWQLTLVGLICGGGLMVTWSAASYLAGVWQTVFMIAALYWPFRVKRRKKKSS